MYLYMSGSLYGTHSKVSSIACHTVWELSYQVK